MFEFQNILIELNFIVLGASRPRSSVMRR